ncbi:MAG: enoyl-CoA hydratase-related protein [Candidatus Binatia bacterium]|nr:enoyl-CoA hydratase-related protein [Candidatus Binatia bacterium]
MPYEQILYAVEGPVATITLNRPDKLNAWTLRMGFEVRHAMWRAENDPKVRVIVVTGAGRGYCAGADMDFLREVQSGAASPETTPPELAVEFDPSLPPLLRGEYTYPMGLTKPVIGAINGVAAGLGATYPLFYDLRVASSAARISYLFARRGLIAEHGSAWLLPRIVGHARAVDLLFTGRFIDADEALAIGLVSRVFPHDVFLTQVFALAHELAMQCSPRSLRIMKQQLWQDQFGDLATAVSKADREMVACFTTNDFREGVAAFLERRSPNFTGS